MTTELELLTEINNNFKYLIKLVESRIDTDDARRFEAEKFRDKYKTIIKNVRTHPAMQDPRAKELFENLVGPLDEVEK